MDVDCAAWKMEIAKLRRSQSRVRRTSQLINNLIDFSTENCRSLVFIGL